MLNSREIDLLRPDVASNCRIWQERCKAAGLHVLITNTVRDREYQEYLYSLGRTRPGQIVTNGRTPTFHSNTAGLAWDFCKNVKGQEYDDPAFFKQAAALAKEMGFSWGGDWRSFPDAPHIQWDDQGQWTSAMILSGRLPPDMPLYQQQNKEKSMTGKEIFDALQAYLAEQPVPNWAKEELQQAVDAGITDGTNPMQLIPRYQAAIMAKRAAENS